MVTRKISLLTGFRVIKSTLTSWRKGNSKIELRFENIGSDCLFLLLLLTTETSYPAATALINCYMSSMSKAPFFIDTRVINLVSICYNDEVKSFSFSVEFPSSLDELPLILASFLFSPPFLLDSGAFFPLQLHF